MNKEGPLVSIIALCYNQAQFCEDTLGSIYNQSYKNIELIIMDDFSSDNSVEKINRWINAHQDISIQFIPHNKNVGICKTLNEALKNAKGKYFELIACDDLMHPEKTSRQVSYLEATNNSVAMVYTDALLINDDGSDRYGLFIQRSRDFEQLPSGKIYDVLLEENFIPAMSVMIKTAIIKSLGGFDEKLSFEDHDMWLRLAENHEIHCMADYTSVSYRLHDNNLHKKIKYWDLDFLLIYSKHLEHPLGKKKYNSELLSLALRDRSLANNIIKTHQLIVHNKSLILYLKYGIPFRLSKYFIKD